MKQLNVSIDTQFMINFLLQPSFDERSLMIAQDKYVKSQYILKDKNIMTH